MYLVFLAEHLPKKSPGIGAANTGIKLPKIGKEGFGVKKLPLPSLQKSLRKGFFPSDFGILTPVRGRRVRKHNV